LILLISLILLIMGGAGGYFIFAENHPPFTLSVGPQGQR